MVKLVDGREVPSDSTEWLLECEARYILNQPTKEQRYQLLDMVEKRRGRDARMNLHDRTLALYHAERERNNGKHP